MKATIYKDKKGNEIRYGDMLKCEDYPNVHLIMCKEQGKDMLYISGMDEFQEISEWQSEEDKKENKISALEIFSWMESRYENIYRKLPFDACLTFDEIKRLYEISQKHIENKDYGFAPVMHLIFTPDDEFPEYQKVSTCSIHDMTKAFENFKVSGKHIEPHIDITDEMKAELI